MNALSRRHFLLVSAAVWGLAGKQRAFAQQPSEPPARRPNILFMIADDWSWPHAGVYGEPGVSTAAFDRIAREGCLFNNAFTAAPQCSPNRAATLTGRSIGQLEEAGTHGSIFPDKFAVYPDLLEKAGYFVGYTGKGWGPGDWKGGGWKRNPAGPEYSRRKRESVPAKGIASTDYVANFKDFLAEKPGERPFCFWFGAHEPHREYERGSGHRAGGKAEAVRVPGFLPDDPVVREDMLDYFLEVADFNAQAEKFLAHLAEIGELDNTLVVITSDNGMPFPRAKANLYEYGTRVPLAMRWPGHIEAGKRTDALFSFSDFAPTFLEAAGIAAPKEMSGVSFLPFLLGQAEGPRQYVITGRERHTHARFDNLGYPSRALRSGEYLYIRNFKPDRWPAGDPEGYHDIDGSPSKSLLLEHREQYGRFLVLAAGKRPEEELYAIKNDPACLENLAGKPESASILATLRSELERQLTEQQDPRVLGAGDVFESYPRMSAMRPELGGFAERGKYNPRYQPAP